MQGERLFVDRGPEEWNPEAHLARVVALLGPPPKDLLERGSEGSKLMDARGKNAGSHLYQDWTGHAKHNTGSPGTWRGGVRAPAETSLEALETQLEGAEKVAFLHFIRSMLVWRPEGRKTVEQLLHDPWLCNEAAGPIKAYEAA